jgi:hypothetical protein
MSVQCTLDTCDTPPLLFGPIHSNGGRFIEDMPSFWYSVVSRYARHIACITYTWYTNHPIGTMPADVIATPTGYAGHPVLPRAHMKLTSPVAGFRQQHSPN